MMEFTSQTFWGRAERTSFAHIRLRDCAFDNCHLPRALAPGAWNRIHDVEILNASQFNCGVDTAAFEEISLHNLKRIGDAPLFLWGCVFRHVKISGRVNLIKINRSVGPVPGNAELQSAWDRAVVEYYRHVDWALDISEAEFSGGMTFEALPGDLIRRSPATQVLVKRHKLVDADWRSLDFDKTAIDIALSWFLRGSLFDSVVVTARADRKWTKRDVAVLNMLRREGIAEAD